jgi:hypothetical protein
MYQLKLNLIKVELIWWELELIKRLEVFIDKVIKGERKMRDWNTNTWVCTHSEKYNIQIFRE